MNKKKNSQRFVGRTNFRTSLFFFFLLPPAKGQVSSAESDNDQEDAEGERRRGGGRERNPTRRLRRHVDWTETQLIPTTNGGTQNGSSVGICERCTHAFFFTRCGAGLHARSELIDKNFCIRAQEEVYLECIVGWVGR